MEEELEVTFLYEIQSKCAFAIDSINQLNRYLNAEGSGVFFVFKSLYTYLNFAANVSLILWPSEMGRRNTQQRRVDRGRYLREVLNIADENSLSNRGLRDHIAHMDERLDDWWHASQRRNIARQNIGPRNMFGGVEPEDIFEHYIPDEKIFVFRGEEFNIEESFNELIIVKNKAYNRLRDLGRIC